MPKIIIKEHDKTVAGTSPYSNFAVVVPGFVNQELDDNGERKITELFDENGIYECSSVTDFMNHIGQVSPYREVVIESTKGVAPTMRAIEWSREDAEALAELLNGGNTNLVEPEAPAEDATEEEKAKYDSDMEVYNTLKDIVDRYEQLVLAYTAPSAGIFVSRPNTDTFRSNGYLHTADTYYDRVVSVGTSQLTTEVIEIVDDEIEGNHILALGYIYKFEPDGTPDANGVVQDSITYYVLDTSKGEDATYGADPVREEKTYAHYGNQMAYELVSMGYTVLYKKLDYAEGEILDGNKTDADGNPITDYPSFMDTLHDVDYWTPLKDRSIYDFRYIIHGLMENAGLANLRIKEVADFDDQAGYDDVNEDSGRGDCIALMDVDPSCYTNIADKKEMYIRVAQDAATIKSKYVAWFAPRVTYIMNDQVVEPFGGNKTFPGYFHYLACAARSSENYNEWYANAGYTRGISDYTIDSVGCKFGDAAVQYLEPRCIKKIGYKDEVVLREDGTEEIVSTPVNNEVSINLIISLKGSYILWGNRTAYALGDPAGQEGDLRASHFLNIRQLCATIKKQTYVACRKFTFDPNSDVLWIKFCNAIRPTLEKMKADQGINDYKIVKTKNDRKGMMTAAIRIVPIEAVEDFMIDLYLEDSLSGVIANAVESE